MCYPCRPRGMLPYWCAYIAWAVTAVCILVCVFFAIMYSLEFDKGKVRRLASGIHIQLCSGCTTTAAIKGITSRHGSYGV